MTPGGRSIALPSRKGLLIRTAASMLIAAAIVFGFVLPVEYQLDPTGFAKWTGIWRIGQGGAHVYDAPFRTDEVDLSLAPGDDYEYKVRMKEGGVLVYSWTSEAPYEFDFHGEADKDPSNAVSYTAGEAARSNGSLIAPFDGIHGWFIKNKTDRFNPIHIKMAGQYELTVDFSVPLEEPPAPTKR